MKYGLGKGLGALLSQYDREIEPEKKQEAQTENITKIGGAQTELELSKIYPNPNQPRKNFDQKALEELADSIKVHGLIQPIIVNESGDKYMIIAGERRWRACQMAGLTAVPVIIKHYTEKQVSEIAIIENLQREDLNPVEVARGIKKLMEEYQLTQEKVAERLGKSRSEIANYNRLLGLDNEVLELVENGKVSFGHAKCLAGLDDREQQIYLAKQVAKSKYTVRELEREISKLGNKPAKKSTQYILSTEIKDLINLMQRKLGTKVNIIGNNKKGRIYIDYYDQDDLDRLYDLLNK
ncbi:MAG: ParB/RepB/Spo0J family partition protein [Clostridia bacterium]|nr:ParB/RepB/Spo0J family partition protein [Clostridia bacterium]